MAGFECIASVYRLGERLQVPVVIASLDLGPLVRPGRIDCEVEQNCSEVVRVPECQEGVMWDEDVGYFAICEKRGGKFRGIGLSGSNRKEDRSFPKPPGCKQAAEKSTPGLVEVLVGLVHRRCPTNHTEATITGYSAKHGPFRPVTYGDTARSSLWIAGGAQPEFVRISSKNNLKMELNKIIPNKKMIDRISEAEHPISWFCIKDER
ncbi:hypothetical protein T265_08122 [Opisthorchis viverrini]|uniref:Uncharacterized protein n=1 Tax=Opisthorchis viverrini TaxID=6198 RepID=A0A074ZAK0_OPIVI|nr:hypothetical protein T265_08122 [Opisthorchis viverrini]KER24133.1 hypothetical protein T265_08122 [Opisthorchis viverrini]